MFLFIGIAVASYVWPRIAGVSAESIPPYVQWGQVLILLAAGLMAASRFSRWGRLHNAANDRLRSGDLEAAARGFEEAMRAAIVAWQASTSRYGLAIASLQLGEPRRALDSLIAIESRGGLKPSRSVQVATAFMLAQCHALLGQLGEARRWLGVGAKRHGPGRNPMGILPEAIVLARDGRFEESRDLLGREWQLIEREGVRTWKHAMAVRAFAVQQSGDGDGVPAVGDLIAGMKPVHPGELDDLIAAWPELRAFLAARQLPVDPRGSPS